MSSKLYYQKDEATFIEGLGRHCEKASQLPRLKLLRLYRKACELRDPWPEKVDRKETLSLIDYHIAVEKGVKRETHK